jgi:hypothetical protein
MGQPVTPVLPEAAQLERLTAEPMALSCTTAAGEVEASVIAVVHADARGRQCSFSLLVQDCARHTHGIDRAGDLKRR